MPYGYFSAQYANFYARDPMTPQFGWTFKLIIYLIDDGMKPNWGTGSHKIAKKVVKSHCPILCPIFSFWRWNLWDRVDWISQTPTLTNIKTATCNELGSQLTYQLNDFQLLN